MPYTTYMYCICLYSCVFKKRKVLKVDYFVCLQENFCISFKMQRLELMYIFRQIMYLYEFRNADKNISACYTGGDGAAELLNAYGND